MAAFAIEVSRRVVVELELDYGDEELAIHVEGLESPGYAPCAIKGMGLAFTITDRAACHLRATVCKAEFAGLGGSRLGGGKANVVLDLQELRQRGSLDPSGAVLTHCDSEIMYIRGGAN